MVLRVLRVSGVGPVGLSQRFAFQDFRKILRVKRAALSTLTSPPPTLMAHQNTILTFVSLLFQSLPLQQHFTHRSEGCAILVLVPRQLSSGLLDRSRLDQVLMIEILLAR